MSTIRRHAVTLIPGDGVGPEVALATRRVLDAAAATAGVAFDWEEAEAGAEVIKIERPGGEESGGGEAVDRLGAEVHVGLGHEFVAGQLQRNELVERHVAVVSIDHPIPIPPRIRPDMIVLEPIGLRESRDVQPMLSPSLPVTRRRQQPIHQPLVPIGGLIRGDFVLQLNARRQSRQIKAEPPQQRRSIRVVG